MIDGVELSNRKSVDGDADWPQYNPGIGGMVIS